MANAQLPMAKAKILGADKKNPQRYRGQGVTPKSGRSVGPAPEWMSDSAKEAWADLVDEVGAWVTYEHRFAVENAALIRGQIRDMVSTGDPIAASLFSAASTAVSKLAASPVDESKVPAPEDGDVDPTDEFLN